MTKKVQLETPFITKKIKWFEIKIVEFLSGTSVVFHSKQIQIQFTKISTTVLHLHL